MSFEELDKVLNTIAEYHPANGNITLLLGDCLEHMKDIPDNHVHLITTDPPYFIDGLTNSWNVEAVNGKRSRAGVVGGLPVGMKFDPKQGRELQAFYSKAATQAIRVLRPGGFFLSFASPRLVHRMAVAVEDAGFEIRDIYAWHYRQGQQKAFTFNHFVNKMDISKERKAEIIKSMGGRKTAQLRPQFEPIVVAQKPKEGTFIDNWMKWKTGLADVANVRINGKKPTTVLNIDKPVKENYNSHLTVKPVMLMETLIKLFSMEGQTVLDPFVGSGTTLIAARNTGRLGVGIEINKEYYTIAKQRLTFTTGRNK